MFQQTEEEDPESDIHDMSMDMLSAVSSDDQDGDGEMGHHAGPVELLAELQAVATTAGEEAAVNIFEEMPIDTRLEQPPSDGGGTHVDAGNELPEFAHIDADADDMVGDDNAEVAKGGKVEGGVHVSS